MPESALGVVDATLEPIVARHHADPLSLVQILRETQQAHGFIAPAALTYLAARLQLPRASVAGVASFYSFLDLAPAGQYRVRFSDGITDRMAGSRALVDRLCASLWLERGKTSEDGLVSVDTTSCTGLCDQGPALLVNGRAIGRLTAERVDAIAELIRTRAPLASWPAALFVVGENVQRAGAMLTSGLAPGAALRATLARGAGDLAAARVDAMAQVERSGARGRGGAGFSVATKWAGCRDAAGTTRYVVCNADEGEPGTFKDRVLLMRHADLVLEGMAICALAVGATHGFVYLRGEYEFLQAPLAQTIERRRRDGLLGPSILGVAGFDFDVALHVGAGAYVCGEASALVESLEGRRGIPRNRPPRLVNCGYRNQPTVVNNVETLCVAALVAHRGGDWYRALGTPRSSGTALLSIAGDCARPGIYEYPYGVAVREVLADCGARAAQAVQLGGPSGLCIGESEFDRQIAFEDAPTAGAFTIFDASRDMFEVARHYTHFFAHESCGFCTPCRVGTTLLTNIMDKIAGGKGSRHDLARILRLQALLEASSHCGLGETACNPIADTLKRFRPSYERRLQSLDFEPAFDLDGALGRARRMTGRDDAGAHLTAES